MSTEPKLPLLAEIERMVEFDPETHTYYVDGCEVEHVTGVLKAIGEIDDRFFTEYGRWRGSAVHLATRYYDEGRLDKRTLDPAVRPYLVGWHKFRTVTKFKPMLIEHPVYNSTYLYAGTFDRAGYFEGAANVVQDNQALIDIKTYNAPLWAGVQLAAYGAAFCPGAIFRRLAVTLHPDETYSVEEYMPDMYLEDLHDFLAMLRVVRRKRRLA